MRFTIGKKISFSLAIIFILILVINGVSINSLNGLKQTGDKNTEKSTQDSRKLNYVSEIRLKFSDVIMPPNDYLINGTVDERKNFQEASKKMEQLFIQKNKYKLDSESLNLINQAESNYFKVKEKALRIFNIDNPVGNKNGEKLMEDMDATASVTVKNLDQIHNILWEDMNKSNNYAKLGFQSTLYKIYLSIIISFAIILGILYIFRIYIIKPINNLIVEVNILAEGNLTKDITIKNNDEVGDLANSFNKMVKNLREIISKVASVSQRVAASSEELSASSEETTAATEQVANTIQQLASGANSQAEEVEGTSTIINQMSAGIQQISANTQSVSQASINVSDIAGQGSKEAENAVSKIERIKDVTAETAEVVKLLGQESEQIGQIVDVIKGIADQTNLLALNAAIEAARAGEQGRGFAVVAEEVRKLAEQSSVSAQQIAELIGNIQKETNRAVEVMDVGTREVAEGVVIVNKAGNSFNVILKEVNKVVEQIQQVSAATQQMAAGSNEVVKSIDSIAAIAQQTAASSQEVSAAAEEQTASMEEVARSAQDLAMLAEELQKSVSRFKL